jgi:hypothetical protein
MKKVLFSAVLLLTGIVTTFAAQEPMETNSQGLTTDEVRVNDVASRANLIPFDPEFIGEQKSLLGDILIPVGGFGGFDVQFTSVNGQFATMMGGGGGALLWHRLFIGGAGYSLASTMNATDITGSVTNSGTLTFGFGGVLIGYTFLPESIVYFSISAMIGSGAVMIQPSYENGYTYDPMATYTVYPFSVYQAGASVKLTVAKAIKVTLGGGYRCVSGVTKYDFAGLTDQSLSGPYGSVSVELGWF